MAQGMAIAFGKFSREWSMTATATPIEIAIAGREWRSVSPFIVGLGSTPTMVLVVGRLDLDPADMNPAILDRWPDAIGDPIRVLSGDGGAWLGNIVFVDHFRQGRPEEVIRVYLAKV